VVGSVPAASLAATLAPPVADVGEAQLSFLLPALARAPPLERPPLFIVHLPESECGLAFEHPACQWRSATEAELTHMEHAAVILASARDVKVAQMNELLHRARHLALPPVELSPSASLDRSPSRLEAEALENRPDIAAAREPRPSSSPCRRLALPSSSRCW
jgi:hypothetical protein